MEEMLYIKKYVNANYDLPIVNKLLMYFIYIYLKKKFPSKDEK